MLAVMNYITDNKTEYKLQKEKLEVKKISNSNILDFNERIKLGDFQFLCKSSKANVTV